MSPNEAHRTLGLSPKAHQGDLKEAYRRLAMKHHPDRNKSSAYAAERFKEMKEAYELLLKILPKAPKEPKQAKRKTGSNGNRNAVKVSVGAGVNPYADEYSKVRDIPKQGKGFHACA